MAHQPERPSPRILIVDDQQSNVRLLEHTLRRGGFTDVMATTDPRDVTALHLEHAFDLILLDLQMPELTGFEVMEQLQQLADAKPVRILVISAEPSDRTAALHAGADSFMNKPFKLPDVIERVRLVLSAAW